MQLVKIHATGSTNDELKLRFRESVLSHLTTIYTDRQTAGKGQHGAYWESEPFKNLTCSVLYLETASFESVFQLNQFISLTLVNYLKEVHSITATIKWPNDILSLSHKLAGILIENLWEGKNLKGAIIGIGLNVNQTSFNKAPKAISLKQITGKNYDINRLLIGFLQFLKNAASNLEDLESQYLKNLHGYNKPMKYRVDNAEITATLTGVTRTGKLLLKSDSQVTEYDIKEVRQLY